MSRNRIPKRVDVEDAITLCAKGLVAGFPKHVIKRTLEGHFGVDRISGRTTERYLARARERLREQAGRSLDEIRAESMEFYRSMAADKNVKPYDRIFARERFDKIIGVFAPVKVEVSDGSTKDVMEQLRRLPPEQRAAAIAHAEALANSLENPDDSPGSDGPGG